MICLTKKQITKLNAKEGLEINCLFIENYTEFIQQIRR